MRSVPGSVLFLTCVLGAMGCETRESSRAVPAAFLPGGPVVADAGALADAAPQDAPGSKLPPADSGQEASTPGANGPLGELPISEIPDVACVMSALQGVPLFPSNPAPPALDRLARAGTRRVAGGALAGGFVLFDLDGSQASPLVKAALDYNLFAAEGETVGAVGVNSAPAIVYRRVRPDGTPLEAERVVEPLFPDALAAAGGAGETLVAWASAGAIRARGLKGGALMAPSYTLAVGAYTHVVALSAARDDQGFGVVWSADAAPGSSQVWFARATLAGPQAPPVRVIDTPSLLSISKVVATSSGFAILLNSLTTPLVPYVLLLDAQGAPAKPAAALSGAVQAWDLAASGDRLALVALRSSSEPALRVFDLALQPAGPWLCLDGPSDVGNVAAVDSDGQGWVVALRRQAEGEVLVRIDPAAQ